MDVNVKTKALYSFEDLREYSSSKIRGLFGGKALGLYDAYLLNLPVPKTWLFPIEHYEQFLKEEPSQQEFQKKAHEWLVRHFKNDFLSLPDTLYAVRSSSQYEDAFEYSFAGIFESILHVSKNQILEAIAEVWDSCFSLRATCYAKKNADLHMGVIIQPMINAKFSGVAFSKHPSPQNVYENQNIVIEFAPHGGEKVVQGEVTPFRLSGSFESLMSATDTYWINNLLRVLAALKNASHHEIDIEFAVDEKEELWLLQQRPISVMHLSHVLDLEFYQRKYKRPLNCLDVELLIEGCSLFLPSYLEVPYQMDKWMVMTTKENVQELWIHELLDLVITNKICQRIQDDTHFLERMEDRYRRFYNSLFEFDYESLFDQGKPIEKRFFAFCEFLLPLQAHYYVPMFMIESLHRLLKEKMEKIDRQNCEADLFKLGTWNIDTLVEIFYEELRLIKKHNPSLPKTFAELSEEDQKVLGHIQERYGFLKCRSLDETAFTLVEIFQILKQIPEKIRKDPKEFESLKKKYSLENSLFFEKFREWMRIRNQEMEFLLFALLKCRPLFEEMAAFLSCSLNKLWNTSKETILYCLRSKDTTFLSNFSSENLVIYRSYGKMRVTNHLTILQTEKKAKKVLKGKTVYGAHTLQGKVKKAFSTSELKKFQSEEKYILVTGMTTPDFIPYLNSQVLALITDEGGILCHAAIVAREIPIPCIVGTAVATEVLKENAVVNIDFDRGEIYF